MADPGRPVADAIVVAAGAATRMDGLDKATAPLAGRPVVAWSVAALAATPEVRHVIVVAPAGREAEIAAAAGGSVSGVVAGGSHRGASVAAGLAALDGMIDRRDDPILLIHDGARPLLSPALASAVAQAAEEVGAAIPVVEVTETLKRVADGRIVETLDRSGVAAAQTPQAIRRSLLRRAFSTFPPDGERRFTDEAALLEACRIPVRPIPGDPLNLKVTVPTDLQRAESLLTGASRRVGLGLDSHPFGPDQGLRLGGLELPDAPRLHGHSDGDVVLHAIADALLGAASLGDLGRLFPADDRTPRGVASAELLTEVVRRVEAAGWRPAAVDLTITAARPRLGPHLDELRERVAVLLELPTADVNVKASTGNLEGAEGAGRVISAAAIATLVARHPGRDGA